MPIKDADYIDNIDDEGEALQPESPINLTGDMKKPPRLADLKHDYDNALAEQGTILNKINEWEKQHDSIVTSKRRKGRSRYVSKLIRKQAEWTYADITEPFLNTPNLFSADPETEEDIPIAKQNEILLNKQFNTKIKKNFLMDNMARFLVKQGTVVLRTGWKYEKGIKRIKVPNFQFSVAPPNHPILQQYAQIAQAEQQTGETPAMIDESIIAGYRMTKQKQVPILAIKDGYKHVEEEIVKFNHPTVTAHSLKDVVIDPNAKGNIEDAMFVVYELAISKSEMRKDPAYQNIDALPIKTQKNDQNVYKEDNKNFEYHDDARRLLHAKEYWGYADISGTGIVEPFICTWIDDIMVRLEKLQIPDVGLPFDIIKYMPIEDENHGEPDAEMINDNQKLTTAIMRGNIDTIARSAAGQRAMRENAVDFENKKRFHAGSDFAVKGNINPQEVFHVFKYPEMPASSQYILDTQQREADALSGTRAFGLEGSKQATSATGITTALDASSKRKMAIIRRVGEGLVGVARKITAMNAELLSDDEVVRITDDQFVPINKYDLAGKFDIRITVSTAENDGLKAKELAFMLQTSAQSGDPEEIKMIRAQLFRLRNMPELAEKVESYKPEPDPIQVEKAQLENELIKAQIRDAEGRSHENFANGNYDNERVKTEQLKQAKLQAEIALLDLDFIEQESGVKQARDESLAEARKSDPKPKK